MKKTIYEGVAKDKYSLSKFKNFIQSITNVIEVSSCSHPWTDDGVNGNTHLECYHFSDQGITLLYTGNYDGSSSDCSITLHGKQDKIEELERIILGNIEKPTKSALFA